MRIKPATLALQGLLAPVHVWGGFFEADLALLFFVFVLAAFVTKGEIFRQGIITICQIYTVLDVFFVVEFIGAAILTLETIFALPGLRYMSDLRLQAERVVGPVTNVAEWQVLLMSGLTTDFARFAIDALPVGFSDVFGRQLQTIDMIALGTQGAGQEVFLVAECTAEVAHVFENEPRIIKRASDRV